MAEHPIRRRPRGLVRVELPQWQPAHRLDPLNAIRSELEEEGLALPIAAEYDDASS